MSNRSWVRPYWVGTSHSNDLDPETVQREEACTQEVIKVGGAEMAHLPNREDGLLRKSRG